MSSKIKTLSLKNCDVDIKTSVSWFEKFQIEKVLTNGVKMGNQGIEGFDGSAILNAKLKMMEILILEIREGENKHGYTEEWMKTLDVEDGDKLIEALDEVTTKKK